VSTGREPDESRRVCLANSLPNWPLSWWEKEGRSISTVGDGVTALTVSLCCRTGFEVALDPAHAGGEPPLGGGGPATGVKSRVGSARHSTSPHACRPRALLIPASQGIGVERRAKAGPPSLHEPGPVFWNSVNVTRSWELAGMRPYG